MSDDTSKGSYEVPKCTLNHRMTLFTYLHVATVVRANGKPSLHSLQLFDHEPYKLFCRICNERFEAKLDENGRIVKGRLINE